MIKDSKNKFFLSNAGRDSLLKPLNLFLILDDLTINNPQVKLVMLQAEIFKQIVNIYPYFNQNRISRECLLNFFLTCKNGVVIIPDVDILTKIEVEFIYSFMHSIYSNIDLRIQNNPIDLNICFWFLCSYTKLFNGKKMIHSYSKNIFLEVKNKIYRDLISELKSF